VQLHPYRVVRVEPGRGEPLRLAVVDACQRRPEPRTVCGEAIDRSAEARRDGPDPLVERMQAIEHRPVVARVAVIVGNAARPHLPVVTDAQQLTVQGKEALIRPARDALVVSTLWEAGPRRVCHPALGRDADPARTASHEAVVDEESDDLGLVELHHTAEANLVQQSERRVVGRGHAEMVTVAARLHSFTVTDIGTGTRVFEARPVRGSWRRLSTPDDVLELMDSTAVGVVACVADAGATFLAPIFDELAAVVCLSGTPLSHIGIVSREYQVPCVMAATLANEPVDGDPVEVDCSTEPGIVRNLS
jgi:hypothetical protein